MLLRRSGRVRGVTFRAHGKCTDAAVADFRVTGKVKAKKLLYSIPNSIDAPCSEFPREEEFGERIVGQFIHSCSEGERGRVRQQASLAGNSTRARSTPYFRPALRPGFYMRRCTQVHPFSHTPTFSSSFSTMPAAGSCVFRPVLCDPLLPVTSSLR